ncbi:MAG: hypothetical protein ACRCW4_05800 [Candidatus Neomicrothrix subdominans]
MTEPLVTRDGQQIDGEAFTRFVAEYPKGQLGLELSEALGECIAATQLYGMKSTMTLTIEIGPTKSMFGELMVKTKVNGKPAQPTSPEVTFFPTPEGGLSRRDPNQSQLPGTETA